ncbi:MAG: redoxin domain-containing protein [Pirellulales bacterium]|nr:redoxin domain-containing protein [Pirellulales bacterium]
MDRAPLQRIRKPARMACVCVGLFAVPSASTLAAEATAKAAAGSKAQAATPAAEPSNIGQKVEGFTLRDYRGRERRLAEFAGKPVVVAFLGNDCPLVKLYAGHLTKLAEEFASRAAIIGINSNRQDSVTEVGAFAQRYKVEFPILKDPDNTIADRFAAVRTPEVFLLDGQGVIRYRGRIDDQFGIGFQKKEPGRRDLATALDEVLADKPVSVATTTPPGCLIGRTPKVTPHGEVTYTKHIAGVLQNRCVECHREGEIAPFPLVTYDEVVGWADMICEVVDEGRMPPWFADPAYGKFENDCRMSDDEKQLLHTWVANGCPQGDASDLPPAREYTTGWRIGQPDDVFYMREKPWQVQAEGTAPYEMFEMDPGFKEDKWIEAAEARPGNRAVVHHIIVFVMPPGGGMRFGGGAQLGYAPGMPPRVFNPGTAMYVPAGSKLMFQMHYTPIGTPQEDLSYIGFKYADPKTVQKKVIGSMTGNFSFRIPPGADNYEVTSKKRFRRDTLITSILPHMHLRGKSMRFELEYPDGHREIVLDVPKYDFNWQLWYNFEEPLLIPKGGRLHCIAHFDNSEDNSFNPDPTKPVTWGEQTWEEMMFGFYSAMDPNENLLEGKQGEVEEEGGSGPPVAF